MNPPDPDFQEAVRLHRAGRLEEAERAYRRVLARDPGNGAGLHGLGVVARQRGQHERAGDLIRKAIEAEPGIGAYWTSLGAVLAAEGRSAEAVEAYRRALAAVPVDGVALNNLGNLYARDERFAEAIECYDRALAAHAADATAHNNLANALSALGRRDEARSHYREALRLRPAHPDASYNLANLLADDGDLDGAIDLYHDAIGGRPEHLRARLNLGRALRLAGRFVEARRLYEALLTADPALAEAHSYLGRVYMAEGRLDEAGRCYDRALALKPDYEVGLVNRLLWMQYVDRDRAEVFAAHRRWGALVEARLPPRPAFDNVADPDRRLRVGYVSGDFRAHSTAWYIAPLLRAHDRAVVEVLCYADVAAPDKVTARLQALADHWRATASLSDAALADLVHSERIDVLVSLDGHLGARLPMFARRPAPVQASWLGYLNTTGLSAIGYRLVDEVTDPPGAADALSTETLVRLPGGWACYEPPHDAPEPGPPPCVAAGHVTFGAFTSLPKLGDPVFDAWSEILKRIPTARLRLKASALQDPEARARLMNRFAARGVETDRLDLLGWVPDTLAHLALYNSVDVVLDTFPHNGVTTTLEALWMGRPVVTMLGDRHSARISGSFLTRLGRTDLIARDARGYVDLAAALAGRPDRLAGISRSLRPALAASSVCDAARFAREVEAAYRRMWSRWCESDQ